MSKKTILSTLLIQVSLFLNMHGMETQLTRNEKLTKMLEVSQESNQEVIKAIDDDLSRLLNNQSLDDIKNKMNNLKYPTSEKNKIEQKRDILKLVYLYIWKYKYSLKIRSIDGNVTHRSPEIENSIKELFSPEIVNIEQFLENMLMLNEQDDVSCLAASQSEDNLLVPLMCIVLTFFQKEKTSKLMELTNASDLLKACSSNENIEIAIACLQNKNFVNSLIKEHHSWCLSLALFHAYYNKLTSIVDLILNNPQIMELIKTIDEIYMPIEIEEIAEWLKQIKLKEKGEKINWKEINWENVRKIASTCFKGFNDTQ